MLGNFRVKRRSDGLAVPPPKRIKIDFRVDTQTEELYPDVSIISLEGTLFRASRFHLASISDPMAAMFRSGLREANELQVHLDYPACVIQAFLEYIYYGDCSVNWDNALGLLDLGNQYLIPNLMMLVEIFLNTHPFFEWLPSIVELYRLDQKAMINCYMCSDHDPFPLSDISWIKGCIQQARNPYRLFTRVVSQIDLTDQHKELILNQVKWRDLWRHEIGRGLFMHLKVKPEQQERYSWLMEQFINQMYPRK